MSADEGGRGIRGMVYILYSRALGVFPYFLPQTHIPGSGYMSDSVWAKVMSSQIEDGRIAFPLKACTVAGNLYGALKSVVAIGGDSKAIGSVVCPSLIIDGIVAST